MKRSKFLTRLLTFALSGSMLAGEILPVMAVEPGTTGNEEVVIEAASENEAPEQGEPEEAVESEAPEQGEPEVLAESEAPAPEEGESEPQDVEDFVFVPGYVEIPDKPAPAVLDTDKDYLQLRGELVDGDEPELTATSYSLAADMAASTDSAFPYSYTEESYIRAYFTTYFPLPRNQNPFGSCWAHSAMGLAEFYAATHGLVSDRTGVNYSELHLVNFCYSQGTASVAGDTGDKVSLGSDLAAKLDAGGNLEFAAQTLMRQRGFAAESTAPYPTSETDVTVPEASTERQDVAYLENAYEISMENTKQVKEAIINNGIVGMSLCWDDSFYNEGTNAFYCNTVHSTNHAVAIVGWDDNYPASNFLTDPGSNGAWLMRNSWNYYGKQDLLSDYCYFWVSYADKSLDAAAWVYEVTLDSYDNNYYYDSQIHSASYHSSNYSDYTSANVYQAKANSGGAEELKAVSFSVVYLNGSSTAYTIRVYTGIPEGGSPSDGTLVDEATTTGTLYFNGHYTVKLKNSVTLKEGEYYAVAVTRSDGGSVAREKSGTLNNGLSMTAASQAGQSFYDFGYGWLDRGTGGNWVIAALTDNVTDQDQSSITLTPATLSLTEKDQTATLSTVVTDADGNTNSSASVSFTSSNPAVASVQSTTNGKAVVTALSTGTTTITATSGSLSDTCTVTVTLTASAPTADKTSGTALSIGSSIALSSTTEGATIYYTLDGSTPTTASFEYTKPIAVTADMAGSTITLKAIAVANGYNTSSVASFSYTVAASQARMELSKSELSLVYGESEALSATVYDVNGVVDTDAAVSWSSSDTSVATVAEGVITTVAGGTTMIKATSGGLSASCELTVSKLKIATPKANVSSGVKLQIGEELVLSCETPGVTIYYTLDGSIATTSSAVYSEPIVIGEELAGQKFTLRAYAVMSGKEQCYEYSEECRYDYMVADSKAAIKLSEESITLVEEGATATLRATVYKADGSLDSTATVTWSSSNEKVATVTSAGVVTAVADGSTTIKAMSGDLSASCTVTVTIGATEAPTASVKDNDELKLGDSITLECETEGANIYYTLDGSEPTTESAVYSGAIVIGKELVGKEVKLQAFAQAEGSKPSSIISVSFKVIDASALVLDKEMLSLTKLDETAQLSATVYGADGVVDPVAFVSWGSSDPDVVTVSPKGLVTAVGEGTATITAKSGDLSASCTVTVTIAATQAPVVSIKDGAECLVGDSINLKSTTKNVKIYYTLDSSAPTVESSQYQQPIEITEDMAGKKFVLNAFAVAEGCWPSDVVTISFSVADRSGLSLNREKLNLYEEGASEKLIATVLSANGKVDETAVVSWSSSNPEVAAVGSDGTVTAVANGTTVITAEAKGFSASCSVTVSIDEDVVRPAVICLTPPKMYLDEVGDSDTIEVEIYDENGDLLSDETAGFVSVDPTIAKVSTDGVVTAVSTGTTSIIVSCGDVSVALDVTVCYSVKFYVGDSLYEKYTGLFPGQTLSELPADPEGDFLCWVDENGTIWNPTQPVTRDLVLYAKFRDEAEDEVSAMNPVPDVETEELYLVKDQSFTVETYGEIYKSSNTKVLTVSKAGKIKAKGAGEAEIYAVDEYGVEYVAYYVTVLQPTLSTKSLSLLCGTSGEITLDLSIDGEDYSYGYPVLWSSSAPAIARVEQTEEGCRVYAVGKGSTTVTAYVNGKTYTAKVKVVETQKVKLTALEEELTLSPMQSTTLKLKGESFKNVTWSSSRGMENDGKVWYDGVVMITKAGKITAVGSGISVLTCEENGAVITVTVPEPAERTVYLNVGKKMTIKLNGVKNAKADWSIIGENDVIDEDMLEKNGTVKGLKTGMARVSCAYNQYQGYGMGFYYKVNVYVENPALETDDTLKSKNQYTYNMTLSSGDTYALRFADEDGYGVYQPVTFKSNKAAAAYVDEYGVIHCSEVSKKTKVNLSCKVNGKAIKISLTLLPQED